MAAVIENLTPFEADGAFACALNGSVHVVICVAARFRLPLRASGTTTPLQPSEEQTKPAMADVHWGDPASSSLRYAGQNAVLRSGGEIYLQGSACAPGGKPTRIVRTRVQVGSCAKEVHALGDRHWKKTVFGLEPTEPSLFTKIPVLYERAFGGAVRSPDGHLVAQDSRNPIGRGLYATAEEAVGALLPNLETPGEYVRSWKARPAPQGFGPIPGSWQPRLQWAGTYDRQWVEEHAPLWPPDIDPKFFHAAAPGLLSPTPFRGGEPVLLEGFSFDGTFRFQLPTYRLVMKTQYVHRAERGMMTLDGILFEPDELSFTLHWRRTVPVEHGAKAMLVNTVRLLESWESTPT